MYNRISEVSFKKLDEYVTEMAKLKLLPKKETSKLSLDIQYEKSFLRKFPEVKSFQVEESDFGVVTGIIVKTYFLIKKNPSLSVKEAASHLMQEEIMKGIKGEQKLKTLRGKIENKLWNLKMKKVLAKERALDKKREDYCKKHGLQKIE